MFEYSPTMNSLESNFTLMTKCTCWLLHATEIVSYAETVPSWFLLSLKVVEVARNML